MHNTSIKSIFEITNLIYFRDIWKMHLLSSEKKFFFQWRYVASVWNTLFFQETFFEATYISCFPRYPSDESPRYEVVQSMSTCSDRVYIYEFDNAIAFKLKIISLFWYLDKFLEKDKSGLLFQINIAWSVFTGLISWRGLHFSHVWMFEPFIHI